MTATLSLLVPGRAIHMHGAVHEENIAALAHALDRELPALADLYGRVAAVVTRDGVAHIIATRRSECRSFP